MLRGEWERIGKEVGEGKEQQMNANAGESGEGRLEEVGGGGWRSRYGEGRGGEGVRRVRGTSGEGKGWEGWRR